MCHWENTKVRIEAGPKSLSTHCVFKLENLKVAAPILHHTAKNMTFKDCIVLIFLAFFAISPCISFVIVIYVYSQGPLSVLFPRFNLSVFFPCVNPCVCFPCVNLFVSFLCVELCVCFLFINLFAFFGCVNS